jgi:hypothetical protein
MRRARLRNQRMTIAALRKYDPEIVDVKIVRASRDTYCIESGTGTGLLHKNGPAEHGLPAGLSPAQPAGRVELGGSPRKPRPQLIATEADDILLGLSRLGDRARPVITISS